jgi:predicted metal-dependent hydrolase
MREYEVKESTRAKHLRVDVYPDGRVVVTKPAHIPEVKLERFIASKQRWIEDVQLKFERSRKRQEKQRAKLGLPNAEALPKPRRGSAAYTEATKAARKLAAERLKHFNAHYRFPYGTLSIRNQKTRWGSCSAAGNLSFNYKIAYLPPALQDYLIVHELCHVKEHNHSPKFWALVGETIPEYQKLRTVLKIGYS